MTLRIAGLGVLLLCAGCTRHAVPSMPVMAPAGGRIVLSTVPAQPVEMDPTQFQIKATDVGGRPVTGAQVTAQLEMPAMDMGRNEITLHEIVSQPGNYMGSGRFTMAGQWQVTVQVDKDNLHQSKAFPFTVH